MDKFEKPKLEIQGDSEKKEQLSLTDDDIETLKQGLSEKIKKAKESGRADLMEKANLAEEKLNALINMDLEYKSEKEIVAETLHKLGLAIENIDNDAEELHRIGL
ncbi:hypothetical protein GF340_06195 [Candidatus Peregrinibacteria bacterium]|nr:hypothetical protein [Candidatus Peregrinibacteria bacterium]